MKKFEKGLFLILFLYCLVRVPLILSSFHGSYDDFLASNRGEKYNGAVAIALLEKLEIPFLQYSYAPYGIGALVNGILTVPFFALLGKTLFALKLVPFCWYFLSLIAWYFVFKKHFSPIHTFFILLFLVLPPPQVTEFMSYNYGLHFESILWIALSLLIFERFLDGALSPKKAGIYLGLIGGFSAAIILTNLLTVAVLWLYLILVHNTKIKKSNFYLFYIPAFLVGFSPLIIYNVADKWSGFEYLWYQVLKPKVDLSILNNLSWTLRHSLQALLNYFPRFAFLYLLSLFYLVWKKRKIVLHLKGGLDIEVFALLFQVLLLGLFVQKGASTCIQYLFPLVPFVGMTLMCAVNALEKKLKVIVGISMIIIGMAQNIVLINFHSLGVSLTLPGYHFEGFLDRVPLGNNFPLFYRNFKKLVEGSPLSNKKGLYQTVPARYFKTENEGEFKEILSFIEGESGEIKSILFEKIGIQLGIHFQWHADQLDATLKQWNMPEAYFPAIYRGAVQGMVSLEVPMEEAIRHATAFCRTIVAFKKNCYEGIGLLNNTEFGRRLERHDWIVSHLEKDFIPDYLKGLGERAFYENHPYLDPLKPFTKSLEDSDRHWFLKGLELGISKEEDPYQQLQMMKYFQELSS